MGICSNLIKYKYSNCLEKLFGFKKKKTKAIPYTFDTIFEFHKKKKIRQCFRHLTEYFSILSNKLVIVGCD
jgi:hypothetical protein